MSEKYEPSKIEDSFIKFGKIEVILRLMETDQFKSQIKILQL